MPRSTDSSAGDRERQRRAALDAYAVLDTAREPEFDDIVAMAARACGTPIAHINFIDGHRQWFKAEVGIGRRELPAEAPLCAATLEEEEILLVPDLAARPGADASFRGLAGPLPRFYAGVPLRTPEGVAIGTLCVLDHRPRELDGQQLFILKALARSVMAQLDLRRAVAERDRALEQGRRAEAERRRGDARSRHVLDSAIDYGIISTDLDGRVTGWNEGARRIMGWTEAEMLGQPASRIFTPEDNAIGRPATEMASALATGRGTNERWHQKRDGTRFWADGEMMALRDEDGAVTGFLKILRDRTERRDAERTLRESRERSDAALASGLVGFVDWDAASGLVRGDARFAGFLGLSEAEAAAGVGPEELLGRIDPADRDAVQRQVGASFAEGTDFVSEFHVARDGGEARWLLLSGRCYRAEGGKPPRLTGIAIDVTASRSAEAALRASEELNRRVLASSGDCIVVMDLDGTVRFVNAGGLQALEVDDAADLLGGPWEKLWPATEGEAIGRALAAARHGGSGRFRGPAATAKGNSRWWDVVVTPIVDAGGAPERLLCVSRDITAEILAERDQLSLVAERDAERLRLKAVLDAAPVGILFAEASGRIVGQNPRADRIFGHGVIPTDVVEGHGDWILYTPDRERLALDRYPLVRALARGETSAGEEYLYRRGDDSLAWVQLTAAPIRDAAGDIAGGVVCIEDIAARKTAEAALRRLNGTLEATVAERTHELDSIWRHSRDMFCVARFDGTFMRLNPAWAETLGWTPEDLLDTPFFDLVHPDDRGRTASAMAVLGDGLSVPGFENRYRHKDGSYRWFSWNAVPHEGLIYSIVRDITDEKEAAAALAKAEEALRQSQKMEAVGQLTGGIAHDFNNLLTGITGALDLMQRRIGQGRTADVGRYVEIAIGSANRAAALTHRLLAFSRRQPLDPRPTDANRLVGSMEDLLRRTTGEAIAFQVALADDLWPTLCDPHQLENALLNLVINARDAMPDGGRLTIETANVTVDAAEPDGPDPGAYVALTVTDTGHGMAPDVAARAFDPFFTTKPMGQGTGLGLSMIYGFVRQSEGHVAIDSAAGRGTRVRIVLPRFAGTAASDVPPSGPAAPHRAPARETVLVVEDEPSVRDLVVEVLVDLGYRALQAPDGPAGLKLLREHGQRIDLLVTDVGLPGMNGRQLAEQGRRLRPDLPVLFITGYAEDATFGEGHLDPGLQMLTKPFTIDALAGRIRAMIEAGAGR
ncbi:PAS domain S-box protein [Lichenibacterium minor]|uniref:histidine kinase n=1 Tax=Lichenibacterium minor TaxID=2316528 RepID=A0A4Q2U6S4_9HYPH|nr:PAS domain S-box protein [Lichenibacterium minor]RYC32369.1 PAS domain S-box protein [Lichenibacterium minor]